MRKIILFALISLNLFANFIIFPPYKPYEPKDDVVQNFVSFCDYFKFTLNCLPLSDRNFGSFKEDIENNLVSGSRETDAKLQTLSDELFFYLRVAIHSFLVISDKEKHKEKKEELQKKIQQIRVMLSLFNNRFKIYPSSLREVVVLHNALVGVYQE